MTVYDSSYKYAGATHFHVCKSGKIWEITGWNSLNRFVFLRSLIVYRG